MKRIFLFVFLCLTFLNCKPDTSNLNKNSQNDFFEFAQNIQVQEENEFLEITSSEHSIQLDKSKLPLKKVMIIPTSVIAYLSLLDEENLIKGVSQPDFIYNENIRKSIQNKQIDVIGSFDEIFVEKIIVNKPDLLISTSSPTLAKFHAQLENEGIQILYIDEFLENHPLGKAEYIKLFGLLTGKKEQANQIFSEIKSNYNQAKESVSKIEYKPKVLVNQMYGDVWYVPGGDSFQANFIKDAGGQYLWSDLSGTQTYSLDFEAIYAKAKDADVWINAGDFPNYEALMASYTHYKMLKPAQRKMIYNWYQKTTSTGANDYFEMGTARPDWVLEDLIKILHPELNPNGELNFYKKLD